MTCLTTLDIGFFRFVGGIAEPGFDRDVGSWGRSDFVGSLTLLVKKKEKRGRRVSAGL